MQKNKNRIPVLKNKWKNTAFIASLGMIAIALLSFFLYRKLLYKPLLLLGYIQLLPAVANLILALPAPPKKKPVRQDSKTPSEAVPSDLSEAKPAGQPAEIPSGHQPRNKFPKKFKEYCKKAAASLTRFCRKFYKNSRTVLVALLIVAAVIFISVRYWTGLKKVDIVRSLSFVVPVVMGLSWLAYTVLEKLCKHMGDAEAPNGETGEESTVRIYYSSVLKSLRGALTVGTLAELVVMVSSLITLLAFANLEKYVYIILSVLFFYETVFLLISLMVRSIRNELKTTPELNIPVPGIGGKDMGVLSYLEENTGITMRSLWSMQLIKKIIPFAVLSVVFFLWAFSGIVKIEAYQQGAHYRLGKLQEEVLNPGLHLTLPWPFDEVEVYDTETINKMTVGYVSEETSDNLWNSDHGGEEYKLLLGGGKELVSINLRVEYKIKDLQSYVTNSSAPEMILQAAAYEAVTERTICTDLKTLLESDRQALAASLQQDITERASKYNTGLEVVCIVLESIHPPVEIAEIYQQLISAEIDAERIIIDAEATAIRRVASAKSNYNFTIAYEQKNYFQSVAKAKSEVADFMASVEADNTYGDHYRYHKYLTALSDAYSKGKLVIVGEGINQGHIYIGNWLPED